MIYLLHNNKYESPLLVLSQKRARVVQKLVNNSFIY